MSARELAAVVAAVASLGTAVFQGLGARTAETTTSQVDDSLRACLKTLEHVITQD